MCGLVHGGDFVFEGNGELRNIIADHMAKKFKEKVAMIGPGAPGVRRMLNRSIDGRTRKRYAMLITDRPIDIGNCQIGC